MIMFCISEQELRDALKSVENAKERGFVASLAVFKITEVGETVSDYKASYNKSVILNAHETDENQMWGIATDEEIDFYRLVDGMIEEE